MENNDYNEQMKVLLLKELDEKVKISSNDQTYS
jgi:hypothetical protein